MTRFYTLVIPACLIFVAGIPLVVAYVMLTSENTSLQGWLGFLLLLYCLVGGILLAKWISDNWTHLKQND
jgi:hypothetical protein